ncbi:unnamed protein product, partial [marine sediment metagenome]
MKSINKLRKRKGVSPVIATVIIVAVTITVAVAVAYWMSGIAGQYTQFEKVEIQSAECNFIPESTEIPVVPKAHWVIVIDLKNSGTKTATLNDVFINDKKATLATAAPGAEDIGISASIGTSGTTSTPLPIESGATGIVTVYI